MTTRGVELLSELAGADAAIRDCWTQWWDMLDANPGGTPKPERDAFWEHLHEVQAARQAIADRTWAYFAGPEATAEERAAWRIWSPAWQHARKRRRPHG